MSASQELADPTELLDRLEGSQRICFDAGQHVAAFDIQSARAMITELRVQMNRYAGERNHYRSEKFRLENEIAALRSAPSPGAPDREALDVDTYNLGSGVTAAHPAPSRADEAVAGFTVEPSIPEEGFNCWWIRDATGRDVGYIEGPQNNERQARCAKAIAGCLTAPQSGAASRAAEPCYLDDAWAKDALIAARPFVQHIASIVPGGTWHQEAKDTLTKIDAALELTTLSQQRQED